ncbi:MAG: ABC transporter substrate-binding protein [Phycisphaerales bacterium]|nr:ABC transporter substrate-binding protein [Phycisphaerales bacterium]
MDSQNITQDSVTIRVGHSPDPDDAFMFYALARDMIDTGRYHFTHEMADIESLNRRAETGELEVSAISIHSYPYVCGKYALLACGCSMGDGYGPMVITREPCTLEDLKGKTIAVPGERTTAFLALNLCLGKGRFDHRVVMFDEIPDAVANGDVDAGLIIHEAQLTYQRQGLHKVVDVAEWWGEQTGLPLPLGGNVIRRDLGPEPMREVAGLLKASIEYSLEHRKEAIDYALQFGRGLDTDLTDQFVEMYVNKWTLDYGERGRKAVKELLAKAHEAGLVPNPGEIEFIG